MKPSKRSPPQISLPQFSLGSLLKPAALFASLSAADKWAIFGLAAANFLPILLAIICGWNVGDVVMFYWWENVVLGLVAILRIAFARGGGKEMQAAKLFCVPFFTVHYFMFCFGHAVFLQVIFFDSMPMANPIEFYGNLFTFSSRLLPVGGWIGIIGLLITHLVSFFRDYIKSGKYKECISFIEMFRPYGRIVVLHVGIIFGGMAAMWLGSPMILVVLLMVLKTIFDLAAFAIGRLIGESNKGGDVLSSGTVT